MTQDDVLFGYRLQLFDLAARTTCRTRVGRSGCTARPITAGSTRSTGQGWRCCARASGGGRRCPTSCRRSIEERIVAFSLGHPGLGPRRVAASWRARSGAAWSSRPTASGRCCAATGSQHARQAPGVDRRLPRALRAAARTRSPSRTSTTTGPASWSGSTASTSAGCTAPRAPSGSSPRSTPTARFAWADLVRCPTGGPTAAHTSPLARRVARDLAHAGWHLERVLSDNGNEFRGLRFDRCDHALGARHSRIRAGRPQTNGHVERLHRTILEECWRPAFARFLLPAYTGLKRHLDAYLTYYNHHRAHTGRHTAGRCPADLVYGARKMEPR